MNRRNFILGLGTAATLSGAASVTGASISGSADAEASFQVIAENDLNLQRNSNIATAGGEIDNSTDDNYVNTSVGFVDSEGQLNTTQGSGVRDVGSPQLTVNGNEDSNLQIAVATPNEVIDDQDGDSSGDPYDSQDGGLAPLEIVNNGNTDKTVSVEYSYGGSVNLASGSAGDGTLDAGDVAELFQFSIGGTQISPTRSNYDLSGDESGNQATVNAGTNEVVDFSINYTADIRDDIAEAASATGSYDFANSAFAAVELLTQVSFGEVDN